MRKIGCLDANDPVLKRRHFLKVGSLSLLGISLYESVSAGRKPDGGCARKRRREE